MGPSSRGAALAYGFGTAFAMWAVGFLCRLPGASAPGWIVLALLLALLVAGGRFAARASGGGAGAGALTGVVASLVNLLVLGSLLSGDDSGGGFGTAALWVPATLALGAALGAAGGVIGARRPPADSPRDATSVLAIFAAAGTLFLVMIGGLVTSWEAGLAVVDWPNSYGYNMFLFPLARMTGGIYWEHAHRLFGSLVGLTTVVLALRVLATGRPAGVKAAALFAVLLVVGQGILGGLRVTGHFTLSDSPEVTRPNLQLAMVHGITGQIFFAWMMGLAAALSRTWREGWSGPRPDGGMDRALSATLVVLLLGQLLLGVRLRHLEVGAMIHITVAVLIVAAATLVAVRLMARCEHVPVLRKTGGALVGHAWTQLILGGVAFMAVNLRASNEPPGTFEAIAATAHQTFGALLLANAVLAWLWIRRLLPVGIPVEAPAASGAR
jgi:cytochrome c oxidase assembly protein subunit 15